MTFRETLRIALPMVLLAIPAATSAQEMMRAIRVHEPGGPEVMKLDQAPRPVPGEGELLVKVFAAGVNPVDTMYRSRGGRRAGEEPYIPGFDVSGIVEATGPGVTSYRPGDEVYAMIELSRGGGYAEYAIVKETEAAKKPSGITHVEAASLPLVTLTAWQVLFDTADLQAGQTVLIHAGAGGVGSVAIQLAKWKGARVIATASEPNHEFLRQLGADVTIDYRNQRFEDVAGDVDVVLNAVDSETGERSLQVLKRGGIVVSIAGRVSPDRAREAGVRATNILVHPDAAELAEIARLIDEGALHPVVGYVFPLAEADRAHLQSETHHSRGKIVLQIVP